MTFYDTAEEVISGVPVTDEEHKEFIFTLFGEGAHTEIENELGEPIFVTIVATSPPPGDGGGKKRASKKQMRTRKGGRRHLRRKSVGKYMEAPRSRAVFQMEGARRRTHRRLKRS